MPPKNADSKSEVVYCTNCGAEITPDSKFCSECGSKQNIGENRESKANTDPVKDSETSFRHRLPGIDKANTSRRNILTGIGYSFLGLFALGALAGDGGGNGESSSDGGGTDESGDSSDGNEEQYSNAWAVHDGLEIVLRNVEGTQGQFGVTITGEATNESSQDYGYVQLEFGLYDETDAKVGDALANTSGLEAGQRWRFEATGTNSEEVASFALEAVTAY